jgi:hypothetical protein
MKTKLLALAFVLALTSAASAKVNWQGEVMITALSAGCDPAMDLVGDSYLSTYLPQNLSDNGVNSWLAFFNRRSGWSIKFTSTAVNSAFSSTRISGRGNVTTGNGLLVSFSRAPATVTETTGTVSINATLSNWQGTAGCTATMKGAYVRRVN